MKKLAPMVIIYLVFIFISFDSFAGVNLLQNPSFEQEDGAMPAAWGTGAWDVKPGVSDFRYEKGEAHRGDRFITIINDSKNDARFTQIIGVEENTEYRLSCWIKTVNVGMGQSGKGANISVEGKLETSGDIKGTNGKWEYVEMYVSTGSGIDTMKVTVGIGGYGAINTGTASFDDVVVEEAESIPDGAVTTQLSNSTQSGIASSSSATAPTVGGPGKTVWYLVIAAVIVAAGAVVYYFGFVAVKKDQLDGKDGDIDPEQFGTELPAGGISETEDCENENADIVYTFDESGGQDEQDILNISNNSDKHDLL